jgi:hypothetical protein
MAARGVQGLIAVTALMGLAACGSVSAGSAGHPASASASSSKAPAAAAGTSAGGSLCADGLMRISRDLAGNRPRPGM